jgi:hypothetical protein
MRTAAMERESKGNRSTDRREVEIADASWMPLYWAAGIAALITTALIAAAIAAHVLWPPPAWSPGASLSSRGRSDTPDGCVTLRVSEADSWRPGGVGCRRRMRARTAAP